MKGYSVKIYSSSLKYSILSTKFWIPFADSCAAYRLKNSTTAIIWVMLRHIIRHPNFRLTSTWISKSCYKLNAELRFLSSWRKSLKNTRDCPRISYFSFLGMQKFSLPSPVCPSYGGSSHSWKVIVLYNISFTSDKFLRQLGSKKNSFIKPSTLGLTNIDFKSQLSSAKVPTS